MVNVEFGSWATLFGAGLRDWLQVSGERITWSYPTQLYCATDEKTDVVGFWMQCNVTTEGRSCLGRIVVWRSCECLGRNRTVFSMDIYRI